MNKRVLLIDDDGDDAMLFECALGDADNTAIFNYLGDAWKTLENFKSKNIPIPHVIFLDINMPSINGWECLKELKKIEGLKKIPVIMYSTTSQPMEVKKAGELGATNFMTKTTDYNEMVKKIKCLMNSL